ncbi:MAG: hypothetical protein JHC87_08330 [Thermoleophilaceae bacterium]|nr:hypothetical protein [Thermoleophilaceae bacterium]
MSSTWRHIDVADYFVVGAVLLGADEQPPVTRHSIAQVEAAVHAPRVHVGNTALYPDVVVKAAVLVSRLCRAQPRQAGNVSIAYVCMIEFLARNGYRLQPATNDPLATATLINSVASGQISEKQLAAALRSRIVKTSWAPQA